MKPADNILVKVIHTETRFTTCFKHWTSGLPPARRGQQQRPRLQPRLQPRLPSAGAHSPGSQTGDRAPMGEGSPSTLHLTRPRSTGT